MVKLFSFAGPAFGLAAIGLAVGSRVIDQHSGEATVVALAGGIFTIALAVYIRD
jgi:hypothetical protein